MPISTESDWPSHDHTTTTKKTWCNAICHRDPAGPSQVTTQDDSFQFFFQDCPGFGQPFSEFFCSIVTEQSHQELRLLFNIVCIHNLYLLYRPEMILDKI